MDETTTTIKIETYSLDKLENDVGTAGEFFDKCGEVFIKRGTENLIFFCTLCGEVYAEDFFTDHLKTDHSDHLKPEKEKSYFNREAQEDEDLELLKIEDEHFNHAVVQDNVSNSDSQNFDKFFEEVNWKDDINSPDNSANSDEDILNSKDRKPVNIEDKHLNNEVQDDVILSDFSDSAQYCEQDDDWNEDNNDGSSENTAQFAELIEEDIPNSKITCKRCNNNFDCVKDLITHDCGLKKLKKDVHQCNVCQKIFPAKKNLYSHKFIHEGIKRHRCETCGASFIHKHTLNAHKRRHTNEKPFKCDYCEKRFFSSTEKKVHTGYHTKQPKYVCEICGKGYMLSSNLKIHRFRHLGIRNFKCTDCNKSFYDAYGLKIHLANHPDAPRTFKCKLCTADFKTRQALHQHTQIHGEKKKYSCKICFKKFAQNAGLYCHMKMHASSKDLKL